MTEIFLLVSSALFLTIINLTQGCSQAGWAGKGWSAGRAGSEEGSDTMGQNLRDCSRDWQQWGAVWGETGSGDCGVSEGNGTSSQMFIPPPTSGIEPTSLPGLQVQSTTSSRTHRNILLKWSRHPQTHPASRRETSSRMTRTQGDNEFVQTYT